MAKVTKRTNGSSSATVSLEEKLWAPGNTMRNNIDAAEPSSLERNAGDASSLAAGRLRDQQQ